MRAGRGIAMAAGTMAAAIVIACTAFGTEDAAAPAPESGTGPGDAAVDSATTLSDGALSGCTVGFMLCDDFERDATAGGTFGWKNNLEGAFLSIGALASVSPTRSLKVQVPQGGLDGGLAARAYLTHDVPTTAKKFRFAFSLLAEVDGPEVQLALIAFAANKFLFLDVQPGGTIRLVEQDQENSVARPFESAKLTFGRWTRFDWEVDIGAKTMTLHRDDADKVSAPLTLAFGNAAEIRIGATFAAKHTTPATYYFDDVGLTAE